jgi:hypothetical protein
MVMKSAEDWVRFDISSPLNRFVEVPFGHKDSPWVICVGVTSK